MLITYETIAPATVRIDIYKREREEISSLIVYGIYIGLYEEMKKLSIS